jgi:hypothetical protein
MPSLLDSILQLQHMPPVHHIHLSPNINGLCFLVDSFEDRLDLYSALQLLDATLLQRPKDDFELVQVVAASSKPPAYAIQDRT